MPAPLKLQGDRFGRLTVISDKPDSKGYWRCRCDCGREEAIHRRQLTEASRPTGQRRQCLVCMRGPCVVCGGPIELPGTRMMNTCSDECKLAKKRAAQLEHYYNKVERDPEYNRKVWKRRAERMANDPDYAESMRKKWRVSGARKRLDPEYVKKESEIGRARYQQNREYILAQRKARKAAMSDEERAALEERIRVKNREWRRQWREHLNQDPERKAIYLDYLREHRRQAALRRMMAKSMAMLDLAQGGADGNDSNED